MVPTALCFDHDRILWDWRVDTTVSGLDYLSLLSSSTIKIDDESNYSHGFPVGPYNQTITASGQMVFVAGQIALDPSTSKIVGERNVKANRTGNCKYKGSSGQLGRIQDVVKTTVLADMNDLPP